MKTPLTGVTVSPVNMTDRKNLGLKAGDTVRVHQKIQDKGKVRVQVFEGLVLARKHGSEPGATFTVRKVASGVGVEKIFPLYSPNIDKIEITRRAKVRRSKLYYIREKVNREIKRQMRRMSMVTLATMSEAEAVARAEAEAKAAEEAEALTAAEAQKDVAAKEALAAKQAEENPATQAEAEESEKAKPETENGESQEDEAEASAKEVGDASATAKKE